MTNIFTWKTRKAWDMLFQEKYEMTVRFKTCMFLLTVTADSCMLSSFCLGWRRSLNVISSAWCYTFGKVNYTIFNDTKSAFIIVDHKRPANFKRGSSAWFWTVAPSLCAIQIPRMTQEKLRGTVINLYLKLVLINQGSKHKHVPESKKQL